MANNNSKTVEIPKTVKPLTSNFKMNNHESKLDIGSSEVPMRERDIKVNILIPESKHRKFKSLCADKGLKLQDVGLDLFLTWIDEQSNIGI